MGTMSIDTRSMGEPMRYATAIPVGRGGAGEVAKAWDTRLGRWVALKFLRHPDPEMEARMVREARAQARVEHPNVCRVYEVGERDGRPYIAMQYVDGAPLDRVASGLPPEAKVALVKTVAEAVHAAHAVGLVHRDLKPGNILVEEADDGALHPYVVDFGIARERAVSDLTVTGEVVGTPGYLSPEQARGANDTVDRRSDVYSLGVVLYELLSGELPHTGESNTELLVSLLGREPRPLRQVLPGVPADLEAVVMRCLEAEPEERYPSARELAEDLGRYLAGEPVQARPATALERLRKRARRNRAAAALAAVAGGVLVLLSAALAAGGVKYTLDLRHEKAAALAAQREAEAREAEAQEIAQFLAGLFEVADPARSAGATVTAREILDRGAARLETDLAGQPVTRAAMMSVMGSVYGRLGLYEEGRRLLEGALALQRRELGLGHPRVADTLVRLGELLHSERTFGEASEMLRRALRIRIGQLGPDHEQVATVRFLLARCLREEGELAQAEHLLREALDVLSRERGPDHPTVLSALAAQASIVQSRGDPGSAAALYAELLERQRRSLGPSSAALGSSLNNLAYALRLDGDFAGAERYYRQALDLTERLHGGSHPHTLTVLQNLAGVVHLQGDDDEVERLLRRKVELERSNLPPDHWRLGSSLVSGLGRALMRRGSYREAEPVLREGIAILETALGPDHSWAITSRGILAACLLGQGREAEGGELVRSSLEALEALDRFTRPNWAAVTEIAERLDAAGRPDVAGRYRALLTDDRRPPGL